MKICIPADAHTGLEAQPFGHFGSAPYFVIHNTEDGTTDTIENANAHHAGGGCQPLAALGNQAVDAFIVGGIGAGAIQKLNAAGVRVFQSMPGTVLDNVNALASGTLPELAVAAGCKGHNGCDH